ncbi:MAG TPA: hypothetical protein VGT00_00920 [Methylomirabilota bacterium]|jgi:hypothetical protein|nr:hypothetical protein [Methylomirabilota bacterium]
MAKHTSTVNNHGISYLLEPAPGNKICLRQVFISRSTLRCSDTPLGVFSDARVARRAALRDQRSYEAVMSLAAADCMVDETLLGVHCEVRP